jgi:hypothetical protein
MNPQGDKERETRHRTTSASGRKTWETHALSEWIAGEMRDLREQTRGEEDAPSAKRAGIRWTRRAR